jgi:hypothetical protein
MRHQRLFCIAALVLMVATFVVVAADAFILPDVKHEPTSCPICAMAQYLTTAQTSLPLVWIAPLEVCWLPPETAHVSRSEVFSQLFCARAPPACVSI